MNGSWHSVILCGSSVVLSVTKNKNLHGVTLRSTEFHREIKPKNWFMNDGRNRSLFLSHPAGQVGNQGINSAYNQQHENKIYHSVAD
jgi:hypothetical protein